MDVMPLHCACPDDGSFLNDIVVVRTEAKPVQVSPVRMQRLSHLTVAVPDLVDELKDARARVANDTTYNYMYLRSLAGSPPHEQMLYATPVVVDATVKLTPCVSLCVAANLC